ncbi:hypothetical protein J6590_087740 [Homalodisca vitripennis]|nr:hypothetical protein J6590_087740 [Homalodisca vitripennis]
MQGRVNGLVAVNRTFVVRAIYCEDRKLDVRHVVRVGTEAVNTMVVATTRQLGHVLVEGKILGSRHRHANDTNLHEKVSLAVFFNRTLGRGLLTCMKRSYENRLRKSVTFTASSRDLKVKPMSYNSFRLNVSQPKSVNPAVLARATCVAQCNCSPTTRSDVFLGGSEPQYLQTNSCSVQVKVSVWVYFKVIWATTVARAIVCVMNILDESDNPLSSDEEDCVAVDSDDGEVDHVEEEIHLPHEEDAEMAPTSPSSPQDMSECDNEDNTPLGNVFYSKDKQKRVMKDILCCDFPGLEVRLGTLKLRLVLYHHFDDDVIEMIVNGTNIYILGIKDQFERERDARPMYKTEIRAFIGILLLSGCLGIVLLSTMHSDQTIDLDNGELKKPENSYILQSYIGWTLAYGNFFGLVNNAAINASRIYKFNNMDTSMPRREFLDHLAWELFHPQIRKRLESSLGEFWEYKNLDVNLSHKTSEWAVAIYVAEHVINLHGNAVTNVATRFALTTLRLFVIPVATVNEDNSAGILPDITEYTQLQIADSRVCDDAADITGQAIRCLPSIYRYNSDSYSIKTWVYESTDKTVAVTVARCNSVWVRIKQFQYEDVDVLEYGSNRLCLKSEKYYKEAIKTHKDFFNSTKPPLWLLDGVISGETDVSGNYSVSAHFK